MPESDAVHTETLWVTQIRKGPDDTWRDNGTYTADKGAVLRIFDYCTNQPSEDFPETQIVRAEVNRFIQSPEELRKMLEEETAGEEAPAVQSI